MSDEIQQPVVQESIPVQQPKLYTDDEVNSIVGRKKAEAAEKARREMKEQYDAQLEQLKNAQPANGNFSIDEVEKHVRQNVQKELQERENIARQQQWESHVKDVANKYQSRMQNFSLDENVEDILGLTTNPEKHPELIFLSTDENVEDTQAFIKELLQSPSKARELKEWFKEDPEVARKMAKQISKSIQNNKKALEDKPSINAPLSQLKPSVHGSGRSGSMSLGDFKKAPWLRG